MVTQRSEINFQICLEYVTGKQLTGIYLNLTINKVYILREGALVSLIVEERNKENVDFYFSTNEDIEMMGIRDDILTFLSQLKFY